MVTLVLLPSLCRKLFVYGTMTLSNTVPKFVYETLPIVSSPALRSARNDEPIAICWHEITPMQLPRPSSLARLATACRSSRRGEVDEAVDLVRAT